MSTAPPYRIYLVDDHPLVRRGLSSLIQRESHLQVCGQADLAEEALDELHQTRPDVMLVDISMGGMDGLELTSHVHALYPSIVTVIASMHEEAIYAERALRTGAQGYVEKREADQVVVEAIEHVLSGGIYLSESIRMKLIQKYRYRLFEQRELELVGQLDDQTKTILRHTGDGWGIAAIARDLGEPTDIVESAQSDIQELLNLPSPTELFLYALVWAHDH